MRLHEPEPERIIRQKLDPSDVLRSPALIGCYGLKPIPQTKPHTCGAAAVATVLRYLGKESNEYQCIEALKPSPVVGITWWPIVQYLRKRGVRARAWVHYSTDQLINNARDGIPTLVEWLDWGGHWVVCTGYDPLTNALVFTDPAKPRSNFTCHVTRDFDRYWIAGGTGSMEYAPALAVVAPPSKHPGKTYEYADEVRPEHILYDWRTRAKYNRKLNYALSQA